MRSKDSIMLEINKKRIEEIRELYHRLCEEARMCKNIEMKTRLMLHMCTLRRVLMIRSKKYGY